MIVFLNADICCLHHDKDSGKISSYRMFISFVFRVSLDFDITCQPKLLQLGFVLLALIWEYDFPPFMVLIIAILNDGNTSYPVIFLFITSHPYERDPSPGICT